MTPVQQIPPYAPAIIRLLQGIVHSEDRDTWNLLISYQNRIREYFAVIGIEVLVVESDGYAYLKQKSAQQEDNETPLPSLIVKRQLSYPVTLLCLLLIEKLNEFDYSGGDNTRLILSRQDIIDMMRTFLPEKTNEAKLIDSIDTHINKITDFGFLKKMNEPDKFEVKRIIRSKINADDLIALKKKLEEYAGTL